MSGKKFVVRHGTIEDFKAVSEIEVYYGMDYLPGAYAKYCQEEKRINYILEVDGIVVSFLSAALVNGDKGVIHVAARTHQDHRGLGYQNYLKKESAKELRALYPNIKELVWCSGAYTPHDASIYKLSDTRKVVFAMPFHYFTVCSPEEKEAIARALQKQRFIGSVEKVDFNRITDYLDRADFFSLFPEGWAIIDFLPYRLDCKSNFTLPHRFPKMFGVSYDENGAIEGVSFRSPYIVETRNHEVYNVEIYCKTEETAIKHVAFNLKAIIDDMTYNNLYLRFLFSLSIDDPGFNDRLKEMFNVSGFWPERDLKYVNVVCDTQCFS